MIEGAMTEDEKDVDRAVAAASAIVDGRKPDRDFGEILVTAEHAGAVLLIACFQDSALAATVLNDGLLQWIEERLAQYASSKAAV